ncbi:MAG: FAD-dependent oxidoreductase [Planctomycetes bacterium]|nr:FAD-dependent oxidoreductase [Planctomycetota bacterium]
MKFLTLTLTLVLLSMGGGITQPDRDVDAVDVVIYGGTSAGIVAGIQARAMGKSVVLIEPSGREGGLTTGGLGQTDIGNKQVIGGLARQFYERIAAAYSKPDVWKWQKRETYRDGGQTRTAKGEPAMWTFEPSVALQVYRDWMAEAGLAVIRNERLNRDTGVRKDGMRIVSITMESGRVFAAKMFLDATYEGDLLAAAGVGYTVGREANAKYGETLNGVQTRMAKYHNYAADVDPYRIKGEPDSGLLPFIDPTGPGEEGSADHRVQAYCFRMCLTDHPQNRIPFHKPDGYNETWYELLLRNFEAGERGMPWINSAMPNRKTDTNNRTGFSTDFIGQNYAYPEASYAERQRIVAQHRLYQQGLMWTLANHPRVPEKIRTEVSRWGMCKDEFKAGGGWQDQLYVREARRMVSDFVMTQNHCQQRETVADSIGMGAYTMDSHHVQRHLDSNGHVRNEGDVEVGGFPPYPISYRSIIPRRTEVQNLLVPVCLSSSHIAFGSIRMEPVFMILGQSAATAACLAIDENVAVQDVDYGKLKKKLIADKQRL